MKRYQYLGCCKPASKVVASGDEHGDEHAYEVCRKHAEEVGLNRVTFAYGKPITPEEFRKTLDAAEVIDLRNKKAVAQPILPCTSSKECDDGQC